MKNEIFLIDFIDMNLKQVILLLIHSQSQVIQNYAAKISAG
jgi:hypothetical protein